jgi:hypothetical protein
MQNQKVYLKQVQVLCEFSQKADPTGIDLEHIFQVMEEEKLNSIWGKNDVCRYQQLAYDALYHLASVIYDPGQHMVIEPPPNWHQLVNIDGNLRLVTRLTTGPDDCIQVATSAQPTPTGPYKISTSAQPTPTGPYKISTPASTSVQANVENLKTNVEVGNVNLPFLAYRAIEILTQLPSGTLRICKANDCMNTFATIHKTKQYCSQRCRNRMNTYAARRKTREAKK